MATGNPKNRPIWPKKKSEPKVEPRVDAYIQFVEAESPILTNIPDSTEGLLITSLTMARRFRFEILEEYKGTIMYLQDEESYKKAVTKFRQALERLIRDAHKEGFITPVKLKKCFDTKEDKRELESVYGNWRFVKVRVYEAIDEALGSRNRKKLKEFFEKSDELNLRFMALATRRWNELIEKELAIAYPPEAPLDAANEDSTPDMTGSSAPAAAE